VVAAGHSVEPGRWQAMLDELLGRVEGRFGRVEPRRRVRAFVLGLLADLPRKNRWTIAEHAGDATPDGMQHLLGRAVWDTDGVQVAVYLTYAGRGGHAMIDREVYLPKSWATDPRRCATAGIPEEVEFATTPALAGTMSDRARDAGVPARWVAADEVYGACCPSLVRLGELVRVAGR
jgi:SRSO17 transposase